MKCFYALWIPILKRTEFKIIAHPRARVLQDSKDYPKYTIRGEIEEKSLDFSLFYKEGKCKREKTLCFHCEEKCSEGFLIYSLELDASQNDPVENGLREKMQAPIYHYIKDFFHCHVHHHPSHDSLLSVCFSCESLSWKKASDRKKIMEHYASLYNQKFEAFEEYMTLIYQDAKRKINSRCLINRGISQLEFLLTEGRGILGEAEFYTTLMEMGAGVLGKDTRKSIQERVERIGKVQREISFSYNLCTTAYGVKLGYWGIWFGGIGILVSALSIIMSIYAKPDYSLIIEHSDSIAVSVIKQRVQINSVMDKNQQELINQLDSMRLKIKQMSQKSVNQ